MRSLRSFFAISSSAPSSTPLRPSFHFSSTRTAYSSTDSGCVVGTSSTAIWLPLRCSKAASVCSSVACCWADSVPVKSVTRAFSGGTATSARANAAVNSATASRTRDHASVNASRVMNLLAVLARRARRYRGLRGRRRRRRAEIDLRRARNFFFVVDRELRFRLVAENHRRQVLRERAHGHVEFLHRLDIAVARDGDAIFGALELRLQVAEVLVGLKLRVGFGDDEQSRQRGRQFALSLLEFLERARIVHELGSRLYAADLRARVGHAEQHVFLLLGETLDGVDEVGHEVRAALVLVDDLGPGGLDLLVGRLQRVVATAAETQRHHQ